MKLPKAPEPLPGSEWWPVQTPIGRIILGGDDEALYYLHLPTVAGEVTFPVDRTHRACPPKSVAKTTEQLDAYFAGQLKEFDLPLKALGTPWQQRVWSALSDIPFGQTRSYADIARAVGNPKATRAVGMANNRNPIALVIPCHRVIGADGSLTGYGGGLDLKTWLLAHENAVVAAEAARS